MPETPAAPPIPDGETLCPLCQGRKGFERLYPRVFDDHYGTRIAAFLQERFRDMELPYELRVETPEARVALLQEAERFGAIGPEGEESGGPAPVAREVGEGEPILRHPRELLAHIEVILVQECTACKGTGACWICKGEGRIKGGLLRRPPCWACAGNGRCRMCLGTKREVRLKLTCERCEGRGSLLAA